MEKILANHVSKKGLACRIYSELLVLNNINSSNILKWAKDPNRHFSKKCRHRSPTKIVQHRAGGVAQVVECLFSDFETMSSNSSPTKKKSSTSLIIMEVLEVPQRLNTE
jgi:hypothetical protein